MTDSVASEIAPAKEVKRLRDATGAGMMDAKRALIESNGDFAAAAKSLREKGLGKAAERTDRENAQGAVAVARDGQMAAVVQLKCETDFVAKSPDFVALANRLATQVLAQGEGAAAGSQDEIDNLKLTLKENIDLGQAVRVEAGPGQVLDTYLHTQDGRGVIAVVVVLEGASEQLAHDVAVHIAFGKPQYLSRQDIPAEVLEEERKIFENQARNTGKPEAALAKISEGMLGGWVKERTLLEQAFAKDDKVTVEQVLGGGTIIRFVQVVVGASTALVGIQAKPRWGRVVLKMSGEAFASAMVDETIDGVMVDRIAVEIAESRSDLGVQLAVVVGGGNIWRGATGEKAGMDRATADHMGMLATVINALALQDSLERQGQPTRVQTAVHMAEIAEPFIRRKAVRHLEKGRVVIFAAGMGNPFFTTDTPAALRAVEIEADVLLKGTHGGVDGVYTADPRKDPTATKLDDVTYGEAIAKELRVMDLTAFTLCKENALPILVFDISTQGNLRRALEGETIGTLIT